ncbi:hypothetical protein BDV32DRAFT_126949 [Aspergillus pseudonomiae]|nr:hypothetical protein BDV32DRAFT_126949 [Aspergillus pseudonomiae]
MNELPYLPSGILHLTKNFWSRSVRQVRWGCLYTSISLTRASICLLTRCRSHRMFGFLHLTWLHLHSMCPRTIPCAPCYFIPFGSR